MCLVCFIAVHVVRKPNPSVKPHVMEMIARSVSLEISFLFSMRLLIARTEIMAGNIRVREM